MYKINEQKDGDGYYHIHTLECAYGPKTKYKYCNGTIKDAADKIDVAEKFVKKCQHCM